MANNSLLPLDFQDGIYDFKKQQRVDGLDIHGKLTIEHDKKVVYVKCVLGWMPPDLDGWSYWEATNTLYPNLKVSEANVFQKGGNWTNILINIISQHVNC